MINIAKLTDKQEKFIEEYLIDLNATQAAIRAGYSAKYINTNASKILQNTTIRTRIDEEIAKRSKRTGINQDVVIRELARLGFSNITSVASCDAELYENAADDDLAAVQSIKVKKIVTENSTSYEREIRMYDKTKSLELLGKHMGMFTDKVDITVEKSEKLSDIMDQLGGEGLEE